MSGTASTNSMPLCLMAARRFEPLSSASAGSVAVRASMCSLPLSLRRLLSAWAIANANSPSAATVSLFFRADAASPWRAAAGQLAVLILELEWSELLHRLLNVASIHQLLGGEVRVAHLVLAVPGLHVEHALRIDATVRIARRPGI